MAAPMRPGVKPATTPGVLVKDGVGAAGPATAATDDGACTAADGVVAGPAGPATAATDGGACTVVDVLLGGSGGAAEGGALVIATIAGEGAVPEGGEIEFVLL